MEARNDVAVICQERKGVPFKDYLNCDFALCAALGLAEAKFWRSL